MSVVKDCSRAVGTAVSGLYVFYLGLGSVAAHEPVFSLGPETIYKGGVGVETEFEFEEAGENKEQVLHVEMLYGLTEDVSLTLRIPQWSAKQEGPETSRGPGDIVLRAKYQFFKKDSLGAQDKAAVIYGVEFPVGDEDDRPPLGGGTVNHLVGLSLGHESTSLYGFVTGRYQWRTDAGSRDQGDQVMIDVAVGWRPWLRPYRSWDLVILLESSYVWTGKDERDGVGLHDTGGQKWLIGPTALWSVRNIMLKGGVQFPVWEKLNGRQEDSDFRAMAGVEFHF